VVGVIFIARDAGFCDLLDPSERSTLGNVVIRLPSYDAGQLKDILFGRVEEAFKPGVVKDEIIEYVADLVAGKKHDPEYCRFASDILLTPGLIADAERTSPVSIEHIRRVVAKTFWGISSEELMALDEHGIAVLTGAVQDPSSVRARHPVGSPLRRLSRERVPLDLAAFCRSPSSP